MTTTSTVAITLDLGCCRCRTKIQKILCSLQERCGLVFEKVVYEMDKVLVSGSFDAVDLCCNLRCKAGCFATKIEIVPPPPPEPKKKKKKKKKGKDPAPPPNPDEPAMCRALVPYPCPYSCPYPCPQPTCPSCRPPPPPCPKPPPPPPPCPPPACNKCPTWTPCQAPPPPCPPPVCNKCQTWMPCQCRGYPWAVCCDENPDPSCSVM